MFRSAALVLLALPAAAQDIAPSYPPYAPAFEACLQDGEPAACVGRAAEACRTSGEGGETTLGVTGCYQMEATLWSLAMARALNDARMRSLAADAEDAASGTVGSLFVRRVEALAAAQATWEAWRDAECAAVYAEWGAGSLRNPEAARCTMTLNAARYERLLDYAAGWDDGVSAADAAPARD